MITGRQLERFVGVTTTPYPQREEPKRPEIFNTCNLYASVVVASATKFSMMT